MEYEIAVSAAANDVIPLISVADAMALREAGAYGQVMHGPTLLELRKKRVSDLLGAAKNGVLVVCNVHGIATPVATLLASVPLASDPNNLFQVDQKYSQGNELGGLDFVDLAQQEILFLWVKRQHLIDWGARNGDNFRIVEVPAQVTMGDLANASGDTIEAGYFQGVAHIGNLSRPAAVAAGEAQAVGVGDEALIDTKPDEDWPQPLTTSEVAHGFGGLKWSEGQWKKPLGDKPKWLAACVAVAGMRGVCATRWNPVKIGAALVRLGFAQNRVRARFQTVPALKPWLDTWKTYEAEFLDNA